MLQNIIESSYKLIFTTNISDVISFDSAQHEQMYSFENIQERINSLHLDYFYEVSETIATYCCPLIIITTTFIITVI